MHRFYKFQAHLGAQTISALSEVDRVVIETTNALMHEEYDAQLISNDVALLYIDHDYTFNGNIFERLFFSAI